MFHEQKIRNAAILFITTLVLSATAWANGSNTFTLAGTVQESYCPGGLEPEPSKDLATASFRPAPPACLLELEVDSISAISSSSASSSSIASLTCDSTRSALAPG